MQQPDYVATRVQKTANTLRGQWPSLLTEAVSSKDSGLPLRSSHNAMLGAEALWPSHLPGFAAPPAGNTSPPLTPPDGLSSDPAVREPSSHGADRAADICKNHSQSCNFSILWCLLWEKSRLLFHGLHCPRGYKKTQSGWPLVVLLFLSYTHTHTHTHTQSCSKKKSHDLTDVSPRASNYEQI